MSRRACTGRWRKHRWSWNGPSCTAQVRCRGAGVSRDQGAVETVHTDLLNRTLRAASTEGHRVDAVVSRVSSQTSTVLGSIDPVGQAARERMRAHRDLPGGGAGQHAPGVDR